MVTSGTLGQFQLVFQAEDVGDVLDGALDQVAAVGIKASLTPLVANFALKACINHIWATCTREICTAEYITYV